MVVHSGVEYADILQMYGRGNENPAAGFTIAEELKSFRSVLMCHFSVINFIKKEIIDL